jgi:hypothetical protein
MLATIDSSSLLLSAQVGDSSGCRQPLQLATWSLSGSNSFRLDSQTVATWTIIRSEIHLKANAFFISSSGQIALLTFKRVITNYSSAKTGRPSILPLFFASIATSLTTKETNLCIWPFVTLCCFSF